MKSKIKPCKICIREIEDEKDGIHVSFQGKYCNMHINCYKEYLASKGMLKVVIDEKIKFHIAKRDMLLKEKIRKEKEKNEIRLKNKKEKINSKENKDKFFYYIMDYYNCNLSSFFCARVATVINGTYKGLKESITYEDLLDMFKRKQKELDKIAFNKEDKGNGFKDTNARLNYDLAVIVNKYESYKKYKERKKIVEAEIIEHKKDIEESRAINEIYEINNVKKDKNENKDSIEISDILEDIF